MIREDITKREKDVISKLGFSESARNRIERLLKNQSKPLFGRREEIILICIDIVAISILFFFKAFAIPALVVAHVLFYLLIYRCYIFMMIALGLFGEAIKMDAYSFIPYRALLSKAKIRSKFEYAWPWISTILIGVATVINKLPSMVGILILIAFIVYQKALSNWQESVDRCMKHLN